VAQSIEVELTFLCETTSGGWWCWWWWWWLLLSNAVE